MTFAAASDGRPWVVDEDCQVISCVHSGGNVLGIVSTDPARTISSFTSVSGTYFDIVALAKSIAIPVAQITAEVVGTQLRKGESVFFSSSSTGAIVLTVHP